MWRGAGLHIHCPLYSIYSSGHRRNISSTLDCHHKGFQVLLGVCIPQYLLFIRQNDLFSLIDGDLSFIEDQFQLYHQYGKDSRDENEGGDTSAGVGDLILLPYAPESALWEHADGCEEGRHWGSR